MKKTFKIIFTVFSVLAIFVSIFSIINAIKNLSFYKSTNTFKYPLEFVNGVSYFKQFEIYRLIFWIFCCITNILFFCVINFKDLQFVTESLIGMFKNTEDKRKENKKQRLAKDIEKKQALLNEMQKDEE